DTMWDAEPAVPRDVWAGLGAGELVLEPDLGLLTGAATNFPVYIDPDLNAPRLRWAYADSTNSNNNDGIARVGPDPGGSGLYRSFFEFATSGLAGRHILGSTFASV